MVIRSQHQNTTTPAHYASWPWQICADRHDSMLRMHVVVGESYSRCCAPHTDTHTHTTHTVLLNELNTVASSASFARRGSKARHAHSRDARVRICGLTARATRAQHGGLVQHKHTLTQYTSRHTALLVLVMLLTLCVCDRRRKTPRIRDGRLIFGESTDDNDDDDGAVVFAFRLAL